MRPFSFDIDVVGACNLRCPSCPQGNVKGYRLTHGQMAPELLRRIVEKARSECVVTGIQLFFWCEPLLHARLPELIRIVQDAGIPCHLSSNLNILPDADGIMAANPASFKISASGFTQEVYGITHRGGDIERVKRHMVELVAAKARNHAATRIYLNFHRYRHNLGEEPLLRDFLAKIGIDFEPVWAQMLPLEKVLLHVDEKAFDFTLTAEDHQLIERLALPPGDALKLAKQHKQQPCPLREKQISIDFQGNVQLCCAGFDARRFTIGNFLAMSLEEIQAVRENHPTCTLCMHHGAHLYMTYGVSEFDALALSKVAPEDAKLLDLRYEFAVKRMKRYLDSLYRKLPLSLSPANEAVLVSQVNRIQGLVSRIRRAIAGRG
jgi:MoaA/NifB/PqqE/SkfB family radical SAM enzyme